MNPFAPRLSGVGSVIDRFSSGNSAGTHAPLKRCMTMRPTVKRVAAVQYSRAFDIGGLLNLRAESSTVSEEHPSAACRASPAADSRSHGTSDGTSGNDGHGPDSCASRSTRRSARTRSPPPRPGAPGADAALAPGGHHASSSDGVPRESWFAFLPSGRAPPPPRHPAEGEGDPPDSYATPGPATGIRGYRGRSWLICLIKRR